MVQYDHREFVKTGGPLSDLFLPQNQDMLSSFPLVEMSEVKGEGRYFPLKAKNRLRMTNHNLAGKNLETRVLPALQNDALSLVGKRELNELDSLIRSSRASIDHPVISQKTKVLDLYCLICAKVVLQRKKMSWQVRLENEFPFYVLLNAPEHFRMKENRGSCLYVFCHIFVEAPSTFGGFCKCVGLKIYCSFICFGSLEEFSVADFETNFYFFY